MDRRKTMVKIRALVRDQDHVDQGIEVARSLADTKLFGRIFEQTRLTPDGLPELGPFFLGNPQVTPTLQYAFLGMLDGLCEGASVDASLHRPTKLHLRKWRMPRWPDRLERLERIRLLRLDKCWFDEVPGFVRDLVALREIHTTQCELRSMTLDNPLLEHVDARSNHLRTLPSIQSARLRVLDVRDNGIETLEGLEQHTGLRRLRMRSSRVLRVGDALGGLSDLELLELSRCGLKTLPEQLGGLGCLEHLDLRENLLESLPDSLAEVQALRALDLTQNRLSHLPSTFAREGALPELRNLRKPGETGYKIPFGGLYGVVSCPNYLGEILEWVGFAIAASTAPGWAFAFFTASNLVPRAVAHHRWYLEKFADYPTRRRAILPFLL